MFFTNVFPTCRNNYFCYAHTKPLQEQNHNSPKYNLNNKQPQWMDWLHIGSHIFENKSSIPITLFKELMIDRSESPNAHKSFDSGVAYMYVSMKLVLNQLTSNTLSGWIRTASFLYCFLMSSSVASLGTPRTLQEQKTHWKADLTIHVLWVNGVFQAVDSFLNKF